MRAPRRRPLPATGDLGRRGAPPRPPTPTSSSRRWRRSWPRWPSRLESMYATARDLIASDDLDAALARITERAATAVRAPKYLLAVRTGADEPAARPPSRLPGRGGRATPRDALLADDRRAPRRVAPRRRGRVGDAATTAGSWPSRPPAGFFPTSASCSTSTPATPRPCSTPRPRSTMPAAATTRRARCSSSPRTSPWPARSEEVAQRLVDAVPVVVDCDRVAVFLWDESDDALTCHAVTELTGDRTSSCATSKSAPPTRRCSPAWPTTPIPQPLFFDPSTDDAFVAAHPRADGTPAVVVVPIAASGRFHGDPQRQRRRSRPSGCARRPTCSTSWPAWWRRPPPRWTTRG